MAKLSPQIQKMRQQIRTQHAKRAPIIADSKDELISVDRTAVQLSNLYERMRYSVDYKEEHLLRRNAITRMLKRRLTENFRRGSVARYLVIELVRAGYLPNNTLPVRVVDEVRRVIAKAIALQEALLSIGVAAETGSDRHDRIMSIAAIEIEDLLFSQVTAHACVEAFYLTVAPLISVKDDPIEKEKDQKNMQTYIACNRSLMGYDEIGIFYRLWLLHVPEWENPLSAHEILSIANDMTGVEEQIMEAIDHTLNWRLMPKLRDYAIFFSAIKESAEVSPDLWLGQQIDLAAIRENITHLLRRTYNAEKKLITKGVYRAIVYILLTKVVIAVIIETPYDLLVHDEINRLALGVNIIFHPLLLFFATRVIRLPKADSREHTMESIVAIIQGEELSTINVNVHRRKSIFGVVLSVLYLFFFILIFSAIAWILDFFNFNLVSGGLFIFFLTLVSYFSLRLRTRAKRWRVTPRSTSARSFLVDLLTLPIVQVGRWLTKKIDKINVFVFILDFIIETPFKLIIEIFEGFKQYLREKKESLE